MWIIGLSPRVRGNHLHAIILVPKGRSIPASAGEPIAMESLKWSIKVYPRECGGTWDYMRYPGSVMGLSPRVRGNLFEHVMGYPDMGSIPASAGEPPSNLSRM